MATMVLIIEADGKMTLEHPNHGMNPQDVTTVVNGPAERIQSAQAVFLIDCYNKAKLIDITPIKVRGNVNLLTPGVDIF